ncbi:MAG: hypothetical protein SNJ84_07145 [Verrucomicrobiia bacterium]
MLTGASFDVAFNESFSKPCVISPPPGSAGFGALATAGVGAVGAAFIALAGTGGTEPVGGFGTLTCTTCIGRVTFKLLGAGIARVGVNVCFTVTAGFAAPPAPTLGGKLIRSVSFFISFKTPVLGFLAPSGNGGTTGDAGIGEVFRFRGPGVPGDGGGIGSGIPKWKPNTR